MSKKADQKKKIIVESAIRVFAKKGFAETRISDIAKEAGIAYGLVYHYFKGKDDILYYIFKDRWNLFIKVLNTICYDNNTSFDKKLFNIISFLVNTYLAFPQLFEVIIIDILHSRHVKDDELLKGFDMAFEIIESTIKTHIIKGELRKEINPRLTTLMIFGSIEVVFSGFALKGISFDNFDSEKKLITSITNFIITGIENGNY